MLRETMHYHQRLAWWNVPYGAARAELDQARHRAVLAYRQAALRPCLAQEDCPIILPAGPGAALGVICVGHAGIEVIAATFVPSWLLRPEQREACHLVRQAMRCTCPRRLVQLFVEARRGIRRCQP